MRIAFHTPLNAIDDGRISGDRRMAEQIVMALERLGHSVLRITGARSYMTTPDLLPERRAAAAAKAQALLAEWRVRGPAPELWFTYHSYYKAPDLLGPELSAALGIAYVVAEASDSERRVEGPWAEHVALARASFTAADLHLCFTDRDRQGVEALCDAHTRFLAFPPFIAAAGMASGAAVSGEPAPAQPTGDEPVRLVTVAMMRSGVKHESYLALARTLARLAERPWNLTIVGDGVLRAEVQQAFAALPRARIAWRGALAHDAVAQVLAQHDVFVWPGLGEAYGLVYLEAQAAGLPVVAYASGGVPWTVRAGETALLVPEGDEAALATALGRLIDDAGLRQQMGVAAATFVARERMLGSAAAILEAGLALAVTAHRRRREGSP